MSEPQHADMQVSEQSSMSGWAFQATEHFLMHITQRNAIKTGFEELTQAFAKRIPQTGPPAKS